MSVTTAVAALFETNFVIPGWVTGNGCF